MWTIFFSPMFAIYTPTSCITRRVASEDRETRVRLGRYENHLLISLFSIDSIEYFLTPQICESRPDFLGPYFDNYITKWWSYHWWELSILSILLMINLYRKNLTSHLIILIESHPSNHVSSIYPQNSNIKLFLRSPFFYSNFLKIT
jgi:hypothetical protein